jgi:hypothetical protein
MKPTKNCFKGGEERWVIGKNTRAGKFNQRTLYACMGTSQWNPFAQLIYTNKKKNRCQGWAGFSWEGHNLPTAPIPRSRDIDLDLT